MAIAGTVRLNEIGNRCLLSRGKAELCGCIAPICVGGVIYPPRILAGHETFLFPEWLFESQNLAPPRTRWRLEATFGPQEYPWLDCGCVDSMGRIRGAPTSITNPNSWVETFMIVYGCRSETNPNILVWPYPRPATEMFSC